MLFNVYVTETREYDMEYTVEAESLEEAMQKAEAGETVAGGEREIQFTGVSDRYASEGSLVEGE